MKKTALFTALIAAAGMASTATQAAPTVYGEVGASLQVDLAKDKPNETNTTTDLKSRKARIGVKGDQPIDDGMKAVYKIELNGNLVQLTGFKPKLDATGNPVIVNGKPVIEDTENDAVKVGTRYMGLETGFGTVLFGKMATPMDDATNDVDVSNNIGGFDSSNTGSRGKNIKYTSPDFSGIKVGVSLLPHAGVDAKGAKNGSFGISGAVSYDNDGIYVALGYETGASSSYYEAEGAKQPSGMRLVTQLNMIENLQLGLMYDMHNPNDDESDTTILGSVSYEMGSITPRFQVTHLSHKEAKDTKLTLLAGVDYAIAEKVSAYSDFAYASMDSGVSGSKAETEMQFDFGLKVKF